jgi:hypothetical protein
MEAISDGDLVALKKVLDTKLEGTKLEGPGQVPYDLNFNESGSSPIELAVATGNVETVQLLLDRGALVYGPKPVAVKLK